MTRVKFYNSSENPICYQFDRLKEIIETAESITSSRLLDILEIYNVLKFINKGVYPAGLSNQQIAKSKGFLNKIINQYFKQITKEDIIGFFRYFYSPGDIKAKEGFITSLENEKLDEYSQGVFLEDFIECYEINNLHKKVTEDDLKLHIVEYPFLIRDFLKSKYFVDKYPVLIKDLFLQDSKNFELVLRKYMTDGIQYFIPTNITKEEMYEFCEEYIGDKQANINYIGLINQGITGLREFTIDAKLKLKARKKSEQIEQELFKNKDGTMRRGFEQRIAVYSQKEEYEAANETFKSLIDLDYLKSNNSPENLLEYLMYLDGFFTDNWILNLCSFPNLESSTLYRAILGVRTKNSYETSSNYNIKNYLMLLSFKAYQEKFGGAVDLRIEDLITYFFKSYSEEVFCINWLPIEFTNKLEKRNIQTKNLFVLEEQIRKQWKLLVEDNEINQELFELESTPPIRLLKSRLYRKYIYLNEKNKDIQVIINLLFSDQSGITYVNEQLNGSTFPELIVKNKINKSNFNNYQQTYLNLLIDNKIISLNSDGEIFITTKQTLRISVLSNIYKYGVFHYYHFTHAKISNKKLIELYQREIDDMIDENLLVDESTLFAKPETDYLNYILNNSEFDNALALRNKYLHGSVINENEIDYYHILIILIFYVIKINEELVMSEK